MKKELAGILFFFLVTKLLGQNPVCGTLNKFVMETGLFGDHTIEIWLPPSYNIGNHFPVIYLLDGQALFSSGSNHKPECWKLDSTLCSLLGSGMIDPCIIVAVHRNEAYQFEEYFPEKFLSYASDESRKKLLAQTDTPLYGDRFLHFLVKELKPRIDQSFSTIPDSSHTFIGGAGCGALTSLYAACEFPRVFGGAICMSPCMKGFKKEEDSPLYELVNAYLDDYLPQPGTHKFYFDYGMLGKDAESLEVISGTLHAFRDIGYEPYSFSYVRHEDGDSNIESWKSRIEGGFVFLFGHEHMGK